MARQSARSFFFFFVVVVVVVVVVFVRPGTEREREKSVSPVVCSCATHVSKRGRVQGLGFRVQGSGFRVDCLGLGFRV
jgi:hypothetical protein